MRKKIIILLVLLGIYTLGIALEQIKVGLYDNAPKIYTNSENKADGFWVEITEEIAKIEGYQIKWVQGTWQECLDRLESGEIDILPDVGITPDREDKFIFADKTTLLSWSRIYIHNTAPFESLIDLTGKKIAALKGSFNLTGPEGLIDLLTQFKIESEIIEYETYRDVFAAIETGEVYAGITNKDFGTLLEKKYNVKRTPIIFQAADLRYAFSKKSIHATKLKTVFDKQISRSKADDSSFYYCSLESHLTDQKHVQHNTPAWFIIILISLLAISLFLYLIIKILRKKVRKKTAKLNKISQEWATTFDNINDHIWILNEEHVILRANHPPNPTITFDSKKLIGTKCYDVVHDTSCEIDNCPLRKSVESHIRESMEFEFKDHWVKIIVDPLLDENDNYIGAVHIIQDITESKKTIQKMKSMNQKLVLTKRELQASNQQLTAHEQQLRAANQQLSAHENQLLAANLQLSGEISAKTIAEEKIKQQLQEKKTLLEELFHRTKNNMQIISSMITAESRRAKDLDSKICFDNINHKIYAMSLVQSKLYESGHLSIVSLKDFITDFIMHLHRQYKMSETNISTVMNLEDVRVLIDTALPVGLVVNEILRNSMQHAFPDNQPGLISINLSQQGEEIILEFSDDGVGLPENFNLEENTSIGTQNILNLVKYQLRGKITYQSNPGLTWRISFNDIHHEERI